MDFVHNKLKYENQQYFPHTSELIFSRKKKVILLNLFTKMLGYQTPWRQQCHLKVTNENR